MTTTDNRYRYEEPAAELSRKGYLQDENGVLWNILSRGGRIDEPLRTTIERVGSSERKNLSDEELVTGYRPPPEYILQILIHPHRVMRYFAENLQDLRRDLHTLNERGVDPKLVRALDALNEAFNTLRNAIMEPK